MRIDNLGSGVNPTPPQHSQNNADFKTTEVNKSSKSMKEVSTVAQQKQNQLEASLAAEKRNAEQEHEVIRAIEKANNHIRTYDRRLEFSIHESTKQIMVKVINTEDDSIIREIPSEKVLDMVAHLWEVAGILVDEHR